MVRVLLALLHSASYVAQGAALSTANSLAKHLSCLLLDPFCLFSFSQSEDTVMLSFPLSVPFSLKASGREHRDL